MNKISFIFVIFLISSFSTILSQNFAPETKWQKIQTPHFSILHDAQIEKEAQRVANTLEHIYEASHKNMTIQPKPIAIVLSNRSVSPNGFVTLAPRRSEWETTPYWPNNTDLIGAGDWLELLAIHEFRHVVQNDQLKTGWFEVANWLMGESGVSILSNFIYPAWFWEGDAVSMETALSDYGRGRNPSFGLHLRAQALENVRYAYPKAQYGSIKDPSINYYDLGYYMSTYVKRHYGAKAWDKIIRSNSRTFLPYATFTMSANLRRHTKLSEPALYHATYNELGKLWREQANQTKIVVGTPLTAPAKHFTNYQMPKVQTNGHIWALKSGVGHTNTFVAIDTNGKEVSSIPAEAAVGIQGFDVQGDLLVWSSKIPDIRYTRVENTVIKLRDLKTNGVRDLTTKGYWFTPTLSRDGSKVAVIETLPNYQHSICVFDVATGQELQRIPMPNNEQPSRLVWLPDGKRLALNHQTTKGKALSLLDLTSGKMEALIPHSFTNTLAASYWNGYVLYTSPLNGVENVYALHLETNKRFQITSAKLAAENPTVSGDTLIFSNYTLNGYQLSSLPLDPATWTPAEEVKNHFVAYYEPLIQQEQGKSIMTDLPTTIYPVTEYKRSRSHFHSWQFGGNKNEASVSLTGSDLVGKRHSEIGLHADFQADVLGGFVKTTLTSHHPAITLSVGRDLRKESQFSASGLGQIFTWQENKLGTELTFPYNLRRGIMSRRLNLNVGIEAINVVKKAPNNGWAFPIHVSISYQTAAPKAQKDVLSRNSKSFSIQTIQARVGELQGYKANLSGGLTLPGIGKHSAFRLLGFYAVRKNRGYSLPLLSSLNWSSTSGFETLPFRFNTEDEELSHANVQYIFPVSYPEWTLGRLFYLQSLKGHLLAGITGTANREVGVGLSGLVNVLNFPRAATLGGYVMYNPESKKIRFAPTYQISL
ncbi:MAG: hypothetical protein JNN12_09530 [Bacteroidetes Order II. Incertae sedis bacterium]|nr:hypothetical protein [Bacteroidetes Order II. bacterium]